MDDTNAVVPFGKYKNQPLAVLAQDPSYVNWLQGQSWFAQRYPNIHTLIINHFGEPEDTPEHNALQARFFDDDFTQRCSILFLKWSEFATDLLHTVEGRLFEMNGHDVAWNISFWCLGNPDEHHGATASKPSFLPGGPDRYMYSIWKPASWYGATSWIHVECKPSLGDEYPGVLRQMLSRRPQGNMIVIERFTSQALSLDVVKAFFASRAILLCTVEEILAEHSVRLFTKGQLPNPISVYASKRLEVSHE